MAGAGFCNGRTGISLRASLGLTLCQGPDFSFGRVRIALVATTEILLWPEPDFPKVGLGFLFGPVSDLLCARGQGPDFSLIGFGLLLWPVRRFSCGRSRIFQWSDCDFFSDQYEIYFVPGAGFSFGRVRICLRANTEFLLHPEPDFHFVRR